MNIKSINTISFTKNVKSLDDENTYESTNSGKISGALGGAILGGLGCYSESKKHNLDEFAHAVNLGGKTRYVLFSCAIYAAIGLGLGSIIDMFVNDHRENKADFIA